MSAVIMVKIMKDNKLLCKICNREFKNFRAITTHVVSTHKMPIKQYYDSYFKNSDEDKCKNKFCDKYTNFFNLEKGYFKYCCLKCANTSIERVEQERNRMLEKYKDPEKRNEMKEIIKKVYDNNKEIKNKISNGVINAHKKNPHLGKKISDGIKKYYKNNIEARKSCSEHTKKLWRNQSIREKMITSLKLTSNTEEYKNKKRKIALELAQNLNWIENVKKGTIAGWNKVPEKKQKQREYMQNGGAAYCNMFIKNPSTPQIKLFEMCQQLLPYPILNYPCLKYSIDIAIPKLNLAIEYDGSYWHKNNEYDNNRQEQIENEGWLFLRYIDELPSYEKLYSDIINIIERTPNE